jgi:hypothetical protein
MRVGEKKKLHVALDIDGCLAKFVPSYRLLLKHFQPDARLEVRDPSTWHFERGEGFHASTVEQAWDFIKQNPEFWRTLDPFKDAALFCWALGKLPVDIMFLTARPNEDGHVERVTREWLQAHFQVDWPLVVSENKGQVCEDRGVDILLEDRAETLSFLPDRVEPVLLLRGYNVNVPVPQRTRTVGSLYAFLRLVEDRVKREGL